MPFRASHRSMRLEASWTDGPSRPCGHSATWPACTLASDRARRHDPCVPVTKGKGGGMKRTSIRWVLLAAAALVVVVAGSLSVSAHGGPAPEARAVLLD